MGVVKVPLPRPPSPSRTPVLAILFVAAIACCGTLTVVCWDGQRARELTHDQATAILEDSTTPANRRAAALSRLAVYVVRDVERIRDLASHPDPELAQRARVYLARIQEESKR